MEKLTEKIQSFAAQNGMDTKRVLDDLLSYIIWSFNPEGGKIPGWSYTKEQNMEFYALMVDYLRVMREQIEQHEWYDAWGDLFMSLTPKGGGNAQFFTPVDICDLMTELQVNTSCEPTKVCGGFGKRVTISDPSCGSSRILLSAHVRFVRDGKQKPYLVGEDVDVMCCKMSAVNMMVHGCFGEVICHNTLTDPKGVNVGFLVNEGLYPCSPGIPTIRVKYEPEWFVSLR